MKIAIGSDERNHLTDSVTARLEADGHELVRFGPLADAPEEPSGEHNYWPAVAGKVAWAVASGEAEEGILFCWTGTGVSIAANKTPGIRAALCDDAETARGARLWNNANVLCLSLRRTSEVMAGEILDMWFNTSFIPNDTDNACLAQLAALE